jgi:peroxiredoxin
VVLDFWATWCGPCGMSLPLVTDATAAFKDKGVVFYAVNEQEDATAIRKFQTGKSLTFPVLLDSDGKVGGLYKASAIPETVLIDKNGKIVAVHVGYDPNVKEKLTRQLNDLLVGKDISAALAHALAPPPAPASSTP